MARIGPRMTSPKVPAARQRREVRSCDRRAKVLGDRRRVGDDGFGEDVSAR
jgi:hypothetical protein